MKRFILKELVWLLIAVAVFGSFSMTTRTNDPIIIGMLVYVGVRISYLYGQISKIKEL
jgi:hypothetical protein